MPQPEPAHMPPRDPVSIRIALLIIAEAARLVLVDRLKSKVRHEGTYGRSPFRHLSAARARN